MDSIVAIESGVRSKMLWSDAKPKYVNIIIRIKTTPVVQATFQTITFQTTTFQTQILQPEIH